MRYLNEDIWFPDASEASEEGLLAIGGDLSPERLMHAYRSGIFPWYERGQPLLWWSPDPRMVLYPKELKISKSMRQVLRNGDFKITVDKAFKEVIHECSFIKRDGQRGTWITQEMIDAYIKLHELGYARSVEVWKDNELVGGLYGIDLGDIFCGESMFSKVSNASKVGFITYVQNTGHKLIDCQVYTDHLASMGAKEIPREDFLVELT